MKAYGRRSTNSMTYKIKYLPLAVQDLNDIARYLSGFYPQTARRVLKEMRVADQYLVFYHVNENIKVVEIHRVLRGSWNLPQYLE